MIYELMIDGQSWGVFPTVSEARYHASYMPKGNCVLIAWKKADGEIFYEEVPSRRLEFNN